MGALGCAQGMNVLELRGVVLEVGPNTPLAGAQVTVYQFDADRVKSVFSSLVTDSTGAFRFKPARTGDYYVEAAVSSPIQDNASAEPEHYQQTEE